MEQSVEIARARKKRGEGASRRGEILEAAKHLFAEEGVNHVTMRRIGAAVGVSPTALYMHFADKNALLAAIAQDTFAELLARLEQRRAEQAEALPKFRAGLRAYIDFGRARPDEYRVTFMTAHLGGTDLRRGEGALELAGRSFDILAEGIAELIAAGLFRPGDSNLLAEAVWATLHGVTALLLDRADHLMAEPEALIETTLDLPMAGLSRPGVGVMRTT